MMRRPRHSGGCGPGRFGPCGDRNEYEDEYREEHSHASQSDNAYGYDERAFHQYEARRPLYRARDGKIMGVCKGLAKRFDIRLRWVRLAFIFGAIFSGFWPALFVYILIGLVMKPEPVIIPQGNEERVFYSTYVSSRKEAVMRLKKKFDSLEGRIRKMEDVVTSKDFDWERRFNRS